MTIFITGSTGFVGRNLLAYLVKNQSERPIVCLVRDLDKAQAQWPQTPRNLRWIVGDLHQPWTYAAELCQAAQVFHVAALVGLRNGQAFYTQNTEGTRQLLSVLRSSLLLERLVFVSSISAIDRHPGDLSTTPLDEAAPCCPQTDYGRSKHQAEVLIVTSGLPYTILIPAYIYGPYLRKGSSTERLLQDLQNGRRYTRFPFPGAISQIHASDLAEALWIATWHPNTLNQRFLISHPQPLSVVEAFSTLANALEIAHRFHPSPGSPLVRYRRQPASPLGNALLRRILWEHYFTCSPAKWIQATGHQPQVPFEAGVVQTLQALQALER